MAEQQPGYPGGRASSVATNGDLLLTHLVFHHLALDRIADFDFDWDAELDRVPELAATTLGWLIYRVDAEFSSTSFVKSTFANIDRSRVLAHAVLADLDSGADVPELPQDYVPASPEVRPRRPNAVTTLVDSHRIVEGTGLTFLMGTQAERDEVGPWLAADPRRGRATWVNQRGKPLLWEFDRQQYSPTGLVTKIWELAGWAEHPVAVQGPLRWGIPGQGTLWDIAKEVQDAAASEDG